MEPVGGVHFKVHIFDFFKLNRGHSAKNFNFGFHKPRLKMYQPPVPSLWTGRDDTEDSKLFYQIVEPLDLNTYEGSKNGCALLGFSSDVGVSRNLGRIGAKEGPGLYQESTVWAFRT